MEKEKKKKKAFNTFNDLELKREIMVFLRSYAAFSSHCYFTRKIQGCLNTLLQARINYNSYSTVECRHAFNTVYFKRFPNKL